MDSKTIKVPSISCGHCAHAIKQELGELSGVVSVAVDITRKSVDLEWHAPATWETIEKTLREINYPPEG